jgi:hypothetical protein
MKLRDDLPILASGLAGVLALAVSTYNVYLQRVQVRAQVWPYLEWTSTNTGDGFSWNVQNVGVGPAIVRGVRVLVDGKPVDGMEEAAKALDPDLEKRTGLDLVHSSFGQRVIPAGVMIHPLEIAHLRPDDAFVAAQASGRLTIEFCYCSTLDECWVRAPHKGTSPTSACPSYPPFD